MTLIVTLSEETCCICGTPFAMESCFQKRCKNNGAAFFCPNGHRMTYTETEVSKLRKEVVRKQQELDQKNAEISDMMLAAETQERSLRAQRGHVTRLKNKAARGECPCCGEVFVNLQRHMATQHPDFEQTELPEPEQLLANVNQ